MFCVHCAFVHRVNLVFEFNGQRAFLLAFPASLVFLDLLPFSKKGEKKGKNKGTKKRGKILKKGQQKKTKKIIIRTKNATNSARSRYIGTWSDIGAEVKGEKKWEKKLK